jgi:hypothetical protein
VTVHTTIGLIYSFFPTKGKTVQSISTMWHLFTVEKIRGPFLVIAPLSTIGHWKREVENWTGKHRVPSLAGAAANANALNSGGQPLPLHCRYERHRLPRLIGSTRSHSQIRMELPRRQGITRPHNGSTLVGGFFATGG